MKLSRKDIIHKLKVFAFILVIGMIFYLGYPPFMDEPYTMKKFLRYTGGAITNAVLFALLARRSKFDKSSTE